MLRTSLEPGEVVDLHACCAVAIVEGERVGVSPNRFLIGPSDGSQAVASRAKVRNPDPFPAEKGADGSKGRAGAKVARLEGQLIPCQTPFDLLDDLQDAVLDEAQLVVKLPPWLEDVLDAKRLEPQLARLDEVRLIRSNLDWDLTSVLETFAIGPAHPLVPLRIVIRYVWDEGRVALGDRREKEI